MKPLLLLLTLAFALHAEDAQPTVEQLQAKVAEQQKQIAEQAAELRLYQQGLFQCQANEIHSQAKAQIDAQGKKAAPSGSHDGK